MNLWLLERNNIWFPDPEDALPDGLLAIGGDLRPERLILAYRSGIFPWFNEGDPICWYSPDPRCILFPDKLHVSHSMHQVCRNGYFEYRFDTAFREVMEGCASAPGRGPNATWINSEMLEAYQRLHTMGIAHSAEAWHEGRLVGGLYGLRMGSVFWGESMFSLQSNASKFCLIKMVEQLAAEGLRFVDCQMPTAHLASLGTEAISRRNYLNLLHETLQEE